jgi:CsoR family transcriptional regulator, copper-sensing transcriptional repressor
LAATGYPGYIDDKDALTKRLRRIGGQVAGVERMVDEERYCIDILTQISAIRSALDRVAIEVLDDHARHCVLGAANGDREERTEEMMGAVARLLKSR